MTHQAPSVAEYRSFAGVEPWDFYEELRGGASAAWDESMQAYVVPSYSLSRQVALDSENWAKVQHGVAHVEIDDQTYRELLAGPGGERHIWLLEGEDYRRMHGWWMRLLAPSVAEGSRAHIRQIVDLQLDRLVDRGRADMEAEFCGRVPSRVIASVMGLPWQDDAWIDRVMAKLTDAFGFVSSLSVTQETIDRSLSAGRELAAQLEPIALQRRSGEGEDLISRFWAEGPQIFADWHVGDVVTGIRHMFATASDTTAAAIANALYVLLTHGESLVDEVRHGGSRAIMRFVEETLRMVGVVHFEPRRAERDMMLGDTLVTAGQTVVILLGAAGRDEAKYRCPRQIDLERASPRDHLAFGAGSRSCVGRALARVEIQEAIAAVLERLPDLRFDPSAPKPECQGFMMRRYAPLGVLFTP
jgi:cytochrome P450